MKPRLLIVDDEPDLLDWLERALSQDYAVVRVDSAVAALAVLAEEEFVALVTDDRMQGMRGLELCARARQAYPRMVRLLVSGFADDPELEEALRSGDVHQLVVKPVASAILRDVIATTVRSAKRDRSE